MRYLLACLAACALSACSIGVQQQGGTQQEGKILLGAHVQPLATPSTEQQVVDFETLLGRKIDIDNTYPGFLWAKRYIDRAKWDIAGARIPMLSWSPRIGSSDCASFADILAGKYDPQLNSQAFSVQSLAPSTVWLRLFFEPTNTAAENCANPLKDTKSYIAAYRYIVGIFHADGVTNAKWVWAPDYADYAAGHVLDWYPGADVVDIVAEDTYNGTGSQEPFSAAVCTIGPQLGKPFAVTETGAAANEQATWLGNVKQACPGLTAFVWFDAVGTSGTSYVLGPPQMPAFAAVGN